MIKIQYSVRHFDLSEEQVNLINEKFNRHFDKYKEDVSFEVKLNLEHKEYEVKVHSNFKSHLLDASSNDFDIYKSIDKVISKIDHQIQKIESKNASH